MDKAMDFFDRSNEVGWNELLGLDASPCTRGSSVADEVARSAEPGADPPVLSSTANITSLRFT